MNEPIPASTPTSDERLLSALAHFFGLWIALIIWAILKDRSRFVRFQAMQAMAYELLAMLVGLLLGICLGGLVALLTAGMVTAALAGSEPHTFLGLIQAFNIALLCLVLPLVLLFRLPPIVAAVSILTGRDFRYPWLGAQVERFLAS